MFMLLDSHLFLDFKLHKTLCLYLSQYLGFILNLYKKLSVVYETDFYKIMFKIC